MLDTPQAQLTPASIIHKLKPLLLRASRGCFRYVLKAMAELTAITLGAGIIWVGLLVSVMAKGEADVSFLKQNFALWFAQAYDGQEADISSFKVQWHPERESLGFIAEGIIVMDEQEAPLLTVKSIYTETPVTALLNRGFEARRLDLDGGQFTIRRDEDGAIFGAIGGPESFGRLGPIIPIAAGGGNGGEGLIDSVTLIGTDVFIRDAASGLSLDLTDVEFLTEISETEIFAKGDARLVTNDDIELGENKGAMPQVSMTVRRDILDDKGLDVSVDIAALNPSEIIFNEEISSVLKQVDMPINLTSKLRDISADGQPLERQLTFSVEKNGDEGAVLIPGLGRIEDISFGGHWDAIADSLDVTDVDIQSEDKYFKGQIQLSGLEAYRSGAIQSSLQNVSQPLAFDVDINELGWTADGVFTKPIEINQGKIIGEYFGGAGRLNLSSISLPTQDYTFQSSGYIDKIINPANDGSINKSMAVKFSGGIDGQLSEDEFLSLWPEKFILGGRNWVKSSIVSATLSDVKFNLDIPDFSKLGDGLDRDAILVDFKVSDGLVQYIRTMTPLESASGYGQLRANGLDVTLTGGRVGEVVINWGKVEIPQFFPSGNDFTLEFEGAGPVGYMVELIDQKPFEYARLYNLNPKDFSGPAHAKLKITRPLREHFDQNRIRYDIEVKGSDIDAPFGLGDFTLTDGDLFLTADKEGMTIQGPAKIGPLESHINWRENFDYGATPTTLNLSSHINSEALDKLGLSLREYFGGDIPFTLQASGEGVNFDRATIKADLSQSEWVFGDLWSKPKADTGELKLSIARDAAGLIKIDDLTVSAPGVKIDGALKLNDDLRLLDANLESVNIDNLISARVTVNRERVADPLKTTFSGDFLNLDGLITTDIWSGDDSATVPVFLSADVNTLRLAPHYQINKANLIYHHSGERIEQFRFSGGNEDGPVILDLQTHDDGPYVNSLKFDIANASSAADAFFKLDSIRGGRLYGEAIRPRNDSNLIWSGTVNVDDFTLVNAPVLAQILSLASLDGLVNVLGGDGLEFKTVELPFTWGKGVLGLEAARASGPALGLTSDGQVDIGKKSIDLDGTLIPAYAANSFFDSIPIFGDILGGKADDATLGLTYNVGGSFDQAKVAVNPLSALTPGVLRQIFKPKREKKRVATPSETEIVKGPIETP